MEEAKVLHGTPQVVTAGGLQGLEHAMVMLHKMFGAPQLREANKRLRGVGTLTEHDNRPAQGTGEFEFGPALNVLTTALTRTKQTLVVVHPEDEHCRELVRLFKQSITAATSALDTSKVTHTDAASWAAAAAHQKESGNTAMSQAMQERAAAMSATSSTATTSDVKKSAKHNHKKSKKKNAKEAPIKEAVVTKKNTQENNSVSTLNEQAYRDGFNSVMAMASGASVPASSVSIPANSHSAPRRKLNSEELTQEKKRVVQQFC